MKSVFILLYFVTQIISFGHAQGKFTDSLAVEIGTFLTISSSSQDMQPLWLISNRYGIIGDEKADLSTYALINNHHLIGKKRFSLCYQLEFYLNRDFSHLFIQEGFVKFNYNKWQLRLGRYEESLGEQPVDISSGGLGISGNALPIPKIGIATTDFVSVPFTNNWVQFKFLFSHGWFGKQRFVKDALLHEKYMYLKAGKQKLWGWGGYQHFVIWAGTHPTFGKFPSAFKDFIKVVLSQSADADSPYPGEIINKLGDHMGVIDLGIGSDFREFQLSVYSQTLFEDQSGNSPINNHDRLLGVSFNLKEKKSLVTKVNIEYISTVHQNGKNSLPDNYYNNGLYLTGWSYLGNIIGTPLFTNSQRAKHYFDREVVSSERWNIINNRIKGIHIGLQGVITHRLTQKALLTFTKNYGNYYNNIQFGNGKTQSYSMYSLMYKINKHWQSQIDVGLDVGDLSNNIGLLIGIKKQLFPVSEIL